MWAQNYKHKWKNTSTATSDSRKIYTQQSTIFIFTTRTINNNQQSTNILTICNATQKDKKFGRNPKGGNKKRSTYHYSATRDIISLPAANFQQITLHALQSGPKPPAPKSPAKKEYNTLLKAEESKVQDLLSKN